MVHNRVLRRTRNSILKIEDKARASIHKLEITLQLKRKSVLKALAALCLPLLALLISLVDPVTIFGEQYMRLAEGANGYLMWGKPSIGSYAKVFIFNVTNAEDFLSGKDHNLKVQEVGPFTYLEIRTNRNMSLDWKRRVLRFIPSLEVTFVPELSVGDPRTFNLTVPNLSLLTSTSMLVDFPIWTNLAYNLLVSNLGTKAFRNLTAQDYMWGYEDRLVELAHTVVPGWINSPKVGFVDQMYTDQGDEFVEVEIDAPKRYAIKNWNGQTSLKQWRDSKLTGSTCNNLQGSYEGILMSPGITPASTLHIYRKQACRTMPVVCTGENVTDYGIKVLQFKVRNDAFDATPQNDCVCMKGQCLPRGLSDLSPCYFGLPLALSKPHFLDCDPSVLYKIEGLQPDSHTHDSVMNFEPVMGFPLAVQSSTQTNIVVKDVKHSALARPFANIMFPMFWVKMEYQEVPQYFKTLLRWRYVHGPALVTALQIILIASGSLASGYHVLRYVRPPGVEMEYQALHVQDKELEVFVHDNPLMDDIEL